MTSSSIPSTLGHALVAGFNPLEIDRLTRCIGQQGFSIDNVDDVIELAHSPLDKYGLIILDLSVDSHKGIAAIERIRQNSNGDFIPVLVLSSQRGNDSVVAALNAGADDYILMPYSERELAARIRSITRYLHRG